jgi:hypothetical protein
VEGEFYTFFQFLPPLTTYARVVFYFNISIFKEDNMINSDRVYEIFMDCSVNDVEFNEDGIPTEEFVLVNGIINNVLFNRKRIYNNENEIVGYLEELPDEFRKSSGNEGYSFLYANKDKHGNEWTDLHERMNQLFMLGIAIEKVEYNDKWMWILLPGGVPLVTYLDN